MEQFSRRDCNPLRETELYPENWSAAVSNLRLGAEYSGAPRFRVLKKLGQGAYGSVYEAFDEERQETVALKLLRSPEPEYIARFKREFRSLVDLQHRNLVRLHELFGDPDGGWYFTMELVAGTDFLSYVRPDGAGSDLNRLSFALEQLAQALIELHAHGRIHRDLKPANVMIDSDARLVVLDFGLVKEVSRSKPANTLTFAGSPGYMAPEQIVREEVGPMSDWYAAGVMLFEALTGELPFLGSIEHVLSQKLSREAPDPRHLNPAIPEHLGKLTMALLARAPEQRASGADVIAAVSGRTSEPRTVAAKSGFVGRSEALASLNAAFEESRNGHIRIAQVAGMSGMGKTALMRHFLDELQERVPGAAVLSGRCYECESVPFKALDAVVDELARLLRAMPGDVVRGILPRDASLLTTLFPVLKQVGAFNSTGGMRVVSDPQECRRRAFASFKTLLRRMAERTPVVIWIDDLQWGDSDSMALLDDIVSPPDFPPILLVLSFRSEDRESSLILQQLQKCREGEKHGGVSWLDIAIDELTPEEGRRLIWSISGHLATTLEERILSEARGNPFFIQELVRFVRNRTGSEGSPDLNLSLNEVLACRVKLLPEPARKLLEGLCLAGHPVTRQLAVRVAGITSGDGSEMLRILLENNLLRATGGPESWNSVEPYHDKVREAVVQALPSEDRKQLHLRLAQLIDSSENPDFELLAAHYAQAGEMRMAREASLRAADNAEQQLAFERAAVLYAFAIRIADQHPELHVRHAGVLAKAGRGYESAASYLDAAKQIPQRSGELKRLAADQLLKSGYIDEGLEILRACFAEHRVWVPDRPWKALAGVILNRVRIRLRGLRCRERSSDRLAPSLLARLDALSTGALVLTAIDPILAAYFQARFCIEALEAGEPVRVSIALGLEAAYRSAGGYPHYERSLALLERCAEMAQRTGDHHAIAVNQILRAFLNYLCGFVREGFEDSDRGIRQLRDNCTGVTWELATGYVLYFWFLGWRGTLKQMLQTLPGLLKEGRARGDRNIEVSLRCLSCAHLGYLAADDPDSVLREAEFALAQWSKGGFHLQHYGALFSRAEAHLYAGRLQEARHLMCAEWPRLRKSYILRWQILRVVAYYLRARAAMGAWLNDRSDRASYKEAAAYMRKLAKMRTLWGEPMARSIQAGLSAGSGNKREAIHLLEMAEQKFLQLELRNVAAACRRRRGEIMGGESGAELIGDADAQLRSEDVRRPDRLLAMYLPGDWTVR